MKGNRTPRTSRQIAAARGNIMKGTIVKMATRGYRRGQTSVVRDFLRIKKAKGGR